MTLESKLPVRKDTHMKISSYMRKKLKYKPNSPNLDLRLPNCIDNSLNNLGVFGDPNFLLLTKDSRRCFSSGVLQSSDMLETHPERKDDFSIPLNQNKKVLKFFRNRPESRNQSFNNTEIASKLTKLNTLKHSIMSRPKIKTKIFSSRFNSPQKVKILDELFKGKLNLKENLKMK
jgi:hypothetical protein